MSVYIVSKGNLVETEVKPLTFSKINDLAIVIGGSIAGLLSARILADRFASVTVVETDKLPKLPSARLGLPQSVQPHILFTKGYRILKDLFPKIEKQLKAEGALSVDWTQEFHHFSRLGWNANSLSPSNLISVSCSRPLLELSIRQQLANYANIQFVEGSGVTRLLLHFRETKIADVSLRSHSGKERQELAASLSAIAATILQDWLNPNQLLSDGTSERFQKRLAKSNSLS